MKNRPSQTLCLALASASLCLFPLILGADDPDSSSSSSSSSKDSVTQLIKDIGSFSQQSSSLGSLEIAHAWLDLFDRAVKLQATAGQMGNFGSAARATFSVLPEPAAWPSLQKLVDARSADKQANPLAWASLRMIVHTLNNDENQQWIDLPSLTSKPAPQISMHFFHGESSDTFVTLGTALSEMSNQTDEVEKFWGTALDKLEHATSPSPDSSNAELELPDLVAILGEMKAEPLVLRALLLPNLQIDKIKGVTTQTLARKLALANIDKLSHAPWFLTKSVEGASLYEALQKKFPKDTESQSYAIYYVISLVANGRSDEAAKLDVSVDPSELEDAVEQVAKAGWGSQVYDFVHSYLGLHPESNLWEFYIDIAAQTGHAADALKFVQESDARIDITDTAHVQIRSVLYRGLLAVDKVDEGVTELRALIKSEKDKISTTSTTPVAAAPTSVADAFKNISQALVAARRSVYQKNPREKLVQWDIELARLGHLLKQEAMENEGLSDAIELVENPPPAQIGNDMFSNIFGGESSVVSYQMETGRYEQAEKLLLKAIDRDTHNANNKSPESRGSFDYQTREHLLKLALVYYLQGRWANIIDLLEKSPGWGAKDLITIANENSYLKRRTTPHLDLMAARALVETGRVDEALPILDYTLQEDASNDAAYALLLKVGKGDLVAKLDALYQQDQFQNRPLIWKATVLLQQGKLAEAEAACKAAIAVDPSDGETGKGDRMREYTVMADICDAKKDAKQADFFRNVIKAIRLSEDADDFYDAGLLTRAVGMYTQALGLFSDAYCIQSRIARQLAELGRMEEAAVHYRKAFELMPVSFGRMESHCFGCERAFKGKTSVDIAEKTFTEMMAKDPQKPQIPYLLGYLYMEEERYPEALLNFQKAAQLDPDYINAWKNIVEIGEKHQLSPAVRDDAVFNLLRLDPARRHITLNTDHVRQLAKLWDMEKKNAAAVPPVPKMLFSLTASAANFKSGEPDDDDSSSAFSQVFNMGGVNPDMQAWIKLQQMGFNLGRGTYYKKDKAIPPLDAILDNKVISITLDFL